MLCVRRSLIEVIKNRFLDMLFHLNEFNHIVDSIKKFLVVSFLLCALSKAIDKRHYIPLSNFLNKLFRTISYGQVRELKCERDSLGYWFFVDFGRYFFSSHFFHFTSNNIVCVCIKCHKSLQFRGFSPPLLAFSLSPHKWHRANNFDANKASTKEEKSQHGRRSKMLEWLPHKIWIKIIRLKIGWKQMK